MNIDTLILSGGGNKCSSFLGSLKYLIDNKIIDFKKIKKIIGVSGGMMYIIPLLLGYSIDETIKIFLNTNPKNLLNYDQFSIQNLINNYGIFENNLMKYYCTIFQKYKQYNEINLKELYQLSKIELIGKVVNVTKNRIEYISYQSHPNLKLSLLIQMTTCIPIIFQPILYKKDYYVDGGMLDNYPLHVFDGKYPGDPQAVLNKVKPNPYTLGLKLMSNNEEHDLEVTKRVDIATEKEFLCQLISTLYIQGERKNMVPKKL